MTEPLEASLRELRGDRRSTIPDQLLTRAFPDELPPRARNLTVPLLAGAALLVVSLFVTSRDQAPSPALGYAAHGLDAGAVWLELLATGVPR